MMCFLLAISDAEGGGLMGDWLFKLAAIAVVIYFAFRWFRGRAIRHSEGSDRSADAKRIEDDLAEINRPGPPRFNG